MIIKQNTPSSTLTFVISVCTIIYNHLPPLHILTVLYTLFPPGITRGMKHKGGSTRGRGVAHEGDLLFSTPKWPADAVKRRRGKKETAQFVHLFSFGLMNV